MKLIFVKILLSLFVTAITIGEIFSKEIIVDKKGNIKSIKVAINIANDGDVIIINRGDYFEGNIIINKKIELRGIDYPVLDGDNKDEILTVISDSVKIKGLLLRNAGVSYLKENAAIRLDEVQGCVIENNKFYKNFFGIYLSRSSNSIISDNFIEAYGKGETSSGNGIHLWYSKEVTISGNNIKGHRDGIYLEFTSKANILSNISSGNLRYGLHFMFSDECKYEGNTFSFNGAGVAVMYSKKVEMNQNKFHDNWGPASFGILLKDISDSRITNNHIKKNTTGIYIEGCNRTLIENNTFESNGWAIKLMANSEGNHFNKNDFVSNSFDISTNSRQNFNSFNGNYWSSYSGYDLDKNNVGDVPFRPVKLYSIITENQKPSLILLHSLFIEILNVAESVIPSLTPEALVDASPSMRRIN